MPMQAGRNVQAVLEPDIELVSLIQREAEDAGRLLDAIAPGRSAVDVDGPADQPQCAALRVRRPLCRGSPARGERHAEATDE